ncbi:MAG: SGNH/GDSL hydrolase family protein [Trebonia sp.]
MTVIAAALVGLSATAAPAVPVAAARTVTKAQVKATVQDAVAVTPTSAVAAGPIVALGDSYTAGDLIPLDLTAKPLGCTRSTKAYPALVASALKAPLVDAACDGAGVQYMTSAQQTNLGTNPPQLNALASGDSVVMLTLSGDDLGFWSTLDTCMELSVTDLFGSPCERHFTSGGTDQLAATVIAETEKITTVLAAIHARAPRARVLVVGYPDLFPQHGGCWPAVPITNGDIAYLRSTELLLNAMLAGDARAAGATFVDTYTPTIGHDFCQSASVKDVEGLVPTSLAYPFHPNARGQAVMATAVLAALRG